MESEDTKKQKILSLVKKGFTTNYRLDDEDYTKPFLDAMKNWEKPDFTKKFHTGNEELLNKAEHDITKKLNEKTEVVAVLILGISMAVKNSFVEIYRILMMVGSPDNSSLQFQERIDSEGDSLRTGKTTSIMWTWDNKGKEVTLREKEGRPFKIKEKFFELHLKQKSFW